MSRHAWAALMGALAVAAAVLLLDPANDGSLILAGWGAAIAAGVIANCRVWPATDDEDETHRQGDHPATNDQRNPQ